MTRRLLLLAGLLAPAAALAVDHVSLSRDGRTIHLSGTILVEARDGGVLLLAGDNVLWMVQPAELTERSSDVLPFELLDHDEAARGLLDELPEGFSVHKTAHYVVLYNTSRVYAEWCGALYERLYRGFFSYWKNKGLEAEEPAWPLVAIVIDNRENYIRYASGELGEAARSIIGYYSMRTNRVVMYDLTEADEVRRPQRIRGAAHINQILQQPAAERLVATIVHEATHQLAYNSGLHTRYADTPYWLSEGLAVYFESPDLKNSKGWGSIGAVNQHQLLQFRASLADRAGESLERLISDNSRFRGPDTAGAAYSEAWALTYFLAKQREKEYLAYLKEISELRPLENISPERKLERFRAHFGDDLDSLDAEMVRFIRQLSRSR